MVNNCVSSCAPTITMCHTSLKSPEFCPEPHLSLRNKIYYCRMELPATNGKRNVLRFSLSTDNYYEALQMIKDIKQYIEKINQLNRLYGHLKMEKRYVQNSNSTVAYDNVVSKDNDVELLKQIKSLYDDCFRNDLDNDLLLYRLTTKEKIQDCRNESDNRQDIPIDYDGDARWRKCKSNIIQIRNVLDKVGKIIVQIQNILYPQDMIPPQAQSLPQTSPQPVPVQNIPAAQSIPHHTIQEVLGRLEINLKRSVTKDTLDRKLKAVEKILSGMGITLYDDYGKLNNQKTINEIETNIKGIAKLGAKAINHRILSINEFIKSANKLEPEYYKLYTLDNIPIKKGTAAKISKTYLPFTQEELMKIFDPKYKIFKKHPDIFYSVLIALLCGARTNGATTLRYTDIRDQDGIKCFDFKVDDDSDVEDSDYDPIKKLKSASTVRMVPIHSKIIELGFLEYIEKYKKRNNERYEGFIFKRTLTGNKTYNKHFMRPLFEHLKALGIKKDRWKAFHSFRNTISNALEDCGISDNFAKKIVGWEGDDTRSRYYSTRELKEIQRELEKLSYPFLDEELVQIAKEIMGKK